MHGSVRLSRALTGSRRAVVEPRRPGESVSDYFPVECQSDLAWTCTPAGGATCTPAGTGDIVDVISLALGSAATHVATCNAHSGEDTEVVNTASGAMPAGVIDPDSANSSSSVTLAINALAIQEIPTLGATGLAAPRGVSAPASCT